MLIDDGLADRRILFDRISQQEQYSEPAHRVHRRRHPPAPITGLHNSGSLRNLRARQMISKFYNTYVIPSKVEKTLDPEIETALAVSNHAAPAGPVQHLHPAECGVSVLVPDHPHDDPRLPETRAARRDRTDVPGGLLLLPRQR